MFIHLLFAVIANAAIIPANGTVPQSSKTSTSTTYTSSSLPDIAPSSTLAEPPITSASSLVCPLYDLVPLWTLITRSSTSANLFGGSEFINPYTATNAASNLTLQSMCSSSFEKSLNEWFSTVDLVPFKTRPESSGTITAPYTSTWSYLGCKSGEDKISTLTGTQTITNTGIWHAIALTDYSIGESFTYTATAPCCGQCHIFGGDVQVYFWPIHTSSPVSILTNSDAFEFISPSIYVAFRSLYASDKCGDVNLHHTPTTIAFRQNELSTAIGYYWNTTAYKTFPPFFGSTRVFTAATFGTEACHEVTESFWQYGYVGVKAPSAETYKDLSALSSAVAFGSKAQFDQYVDMGWIHEFTVTHNPCSPTIPVPTQLYSIDSLWSNCGDDLTGLYDPPFTLTSGSGLEPVLATVAAPVTSSSADPILPAGTPTPLTPIMTSAPTPTSSPKPATSVSRNDPPFETASPPATNDPIVIQDPPSPSNNDPPIETATQPATNDPTVIQDPPSPSNNGPTIPHDDSTSANNDPAIAQDPPSPTTPPPTHSVTAIIIGTQTVLPGGPEVIISGTSISLQPDASSIIINGNTAPLSSALVPSSHAFIIESQTLVPGGAAITVSGTTVSLESGGSSVVVGGSTQALSSFLGQTTVTASFVGIGGIVASIGGFVDGSPSTSTVNGQGGNGSYDGPVFLGGVESWRKSVGGWRWVVVVGVGWVIR